MIGEVQRNYRLEARKEELLRQEIQVDLVIYPSLYYFFLPNIRRGVVEKKKLVRIKIY